jgi:hypothetical protein
VIVEVGVESAALSLCQPDGQVAEVGLTQDSVLLIDLGGGEKNEIVDGAGIDFRVYEFPNGPGIYLDRMEVAVAPDVDGQPGEFEVVFVWGDDNGSNNQSIPDRYLPEIADRGIEAADLYRGAAIEIDVGRQDGQRYRYVRVRTYPPGQIPPEAHRAQIDAIEKAEDGRVKTRPSSGKISGCVCGRFRTGTVLRSDTFRQVAPASRELQ